MVKGLPGFNAWVRKIPWRREWQPTPVSLPGQFHGQRSLAGYSPWGHREIRHDWVTNTCVDARARVHTHTCVKPEATPQGCLGAEPCLCCSLMCAPVPGAVHGKCQRLQRPLWWVTGLGERRRGAWPRPDTLLFSAGRKAPAEGLPVAQRCEGGCTCSVNWSSLTLPECSLQRHRWKMLDSGELDWAWSRRASGPNIQEARSHFTSTLHTTRRTPCQKSSTVSWGPILLVVAGVLKFCEPLVNFSSLGEDEDIG